MLWLFFQAYRRLPAGFLLLRYSVLFTVKSLSLLYLLFMMEGPRVRASPASLRCGP